MTEKLEIRIIELPKITNLSNEDDELLDWLFFLDNPNSERVIKKMKENDELKEASEKLDKISQDEHMRRIAEWREKAIIEENTAISAGFERGFDKGLKEGHKEGIKKGIKKGIKEGIEQNKIDIATKLLKENMDIEFIEKITGLSFNEINELMNKLNK